MNKNRNIEYTIKNIDRCWNVRIAAEQKQADFENRLAKIVISWLYRNNRKRLKNLDKSPFGMFMHNAQFSKETGIVKAHLWCSIKNTDGTESTWFETYEVKMSDLKR